MHGSRRTRASVDQAERWERPSGTFVPQGPADRPADRPPVVAVTGATGPRASFMAGAFDELENVVRPVHYSAASGGCISALVGAVGMRSEDRQRMNAGAPWHKLLQRAEGVARPLGPLERRNLDLAGTYDLSEYERWLTRWLEWSGVRTWDDLRYAEGEPRPEGSTHKVSMSVVVWRAKGPMPHLYREDALRDPAFVHWAFRQKYFSSSFPWRSFEEVWLPNQAEALRGVVGFEEIEQRSPAEVALWSASLWPAVPGRVGQDRRTKELVFVADGGHVHNQPIEWNDGRPPPTLVDARGPFGGGPLPMVNLRGGAVEGKAAAAQRRADRRAVPYGLTLRASVDVPAGVKGLRQLQTMGAADRRRMYEEGRSYVRDEGADLVREYFAHFPAMVRTAHERHGGRVEVVEPLHGFRAIAAKPRPGARTSPTELHW